MPPVQKYLAYPLPQLRLWLFLLALSFAVSDSPGQQAITQMRESMLEQIYDEQFRPRDILSGKNYAPNYEHISGHQFFFDYYESEGYFIYDGIKYNNLPFQYDIYNQAMLVRMNDKEYGLTTITIASDKVTEFKSGDIKFVRYKSESMPEDFYQIAHQGLRSMLMVKRSKEVKKLTQNLHGKLRMFITKNRYFLFFDKNVREIKSKRDLFEAFGENESLVSYAKKLRIGFKKDEFEEKLISILAYYEEL